MTIPTVVIDEIIDPAWGNAVADAVNDQLARPGCLLRPTAPTSIPNATNSAAIWQNERFDNGGYHAPSSSSIIIPAGLGGLYFVSYAMNVDNSGGTISAWMDATASMGTRICQSSVGTSAGSIQGSAMIPMLAGQAIFVGVFQTTGVARNVNNNNVGFFQCIRMGDS